MQLGMIGLGRMGANMTTRLIRGGHTVAAYDRDAAAVARSAADGAVGASSLADLVGKLTAPRAVWIMVPAGDPTDSTINELLGLLAPGDAIIDGGNSKWTDSKARAERCKAKGVAFVDAGTSGGVWGLANGYCLMVGGDADAVKRVEPIFLTLAPEGGYAHVGPSGAGHFSKMVHNGIEYGMLAAYGEGFEILEKSEYDYDLHELASIWRYGSVVRSWLLELLELALKSDPDLAKVKGWVADSGEGRWTVQAAIDEDVPAPVITASLMSRFVSRQSESFSAKVIAALRNEFGGHAREVGMTTTAPAVNPLRKGLASSRITDPCNIVFFGATGDLMHRMLMPAMWNLRLGDILPENYGIIGYSRSDDDDEKFRDEMHKSIDEFSRSGPAKDPLWSDFAKHLSYISGTFDDTEGFHKLREQLEKNDRELGTGGNRLFYLSTPPSTFAKIVDQLDQAGLGPRDNPKGWSRIIVEKPFGTDLDSARALQAEVSKVFDEKLIYRIDHYLGKEPVQDIMALRFANIIFEPIWNRRYVDSVQITAAETVGVELRGGYYDNAGALRDMIQNHVMNLLALVAMEPPVASDADSIRDEKFKVLRAIRPIEPARVTLDSARGQYDAGSIAGKPVPGYREEPDVRPDSNTETYAAVKLWIDNWRWADVPFYLRSGKRLGHKNSEIAIRFRSLPHRLFGEAGDALDNNVLVMKIQPEEGVSLRFNAKVPGPKMHIRSVSMDFNYGTGFGVVSAPAYERLIGDAMRGDATLFTRWDAVETAWQIVMPILDRWIDSIDESFPNYSAGSQGPPSSDRMLAMDGREWRKI